MRSSFKIVSFVLSVENWLFAWCEKCILGMHIVFEAMNKIW